MIDELLQGRRLNKDSPIPYYYQLAQLLREAMEDVPGGARRVRWRCPRSRPWPGSSR